MQHGFCPAILHVGTLSPWDVPAQTHRACEGRCSPRGCPSFSQEMWGVGCPSARHSSLTPLPSSTLCSLGSPALLIRGGTAPRREGG